MSNERLRARAGASELDGARSDRPKAPGSARRAPSQPRRVRIRSSPRPSRIQANPSAAESFGRKESPTLAAVCAAKRTRAPSNQRYRRQSLRCHCVRDRTNPSGKGRGRVRELDHLGARAVDVVRAHRCPAPGRPDARARCCRARRRALVPEDLHDQAGSSRHADAVLEHGARAGHQRHGRRIARGERALQPVQGDGDLAVGELDAAVRSGAILAAAGLLGDAKVDVIAWNGTSAAWLGFETDERLCEAITAATGIAATT